MNFDKRATRSFTFLSLLSAMDAMDRGCDWKATGFKTRPFGNAALLIPSSKLICAPDGRLCASFSNCSNRVARQRNATQPAKA